MKYLFIITMLVCSSASAEPVTLVSGQGQKVLIELYTSEGCSSCPPAEKYLNTYRHNKELWHTYIPVAFHVDYWDYIGWKDRFASPSFSTRQRQHARERNVRSVYTPSFMVNGAGWQPGWFGNKAPNVKSAISGKLNVTINEKQLTASYVSPVEQENDLRLHIALLGMDLVSHINAGENRDRTLPHDFVVIGFKTIRSHDGEWQTLLPELHFSETEASAIAVWVTQNHSLKPLQAVGGYL